MAFTPTVITPVVGLISIPVSFVIENVRVPVPPVTEYAREVYENPCVVVIVEAPEIVMVSLTIIEIARVLVMPKLSVAVMVSL